MYLQSILFPRISIKSSPGALIVRETEKVLDEKITTRTEEVPCPLTGIPHLRTVEVVEKIIETEVVYKTIPFSQLVSCTACEFYSVRRTVNMLYFAPIFFFTHYLFRLLFLSCFFLCSVDLCSFHLLPSPPPPLLLYSYLGVSFVIVFFRFCRCLFPAILDWPCRCSL